jgi:hypothetical protein
MKIRLAVLALLLGLVSQVKADQITTGNISFTCCTLDPTVSTVTATAGSFVYDNTTNQFLNIDATWDGMAFELVGAFSGFADPAAIYQGLIGTGTEWIAHCYSVDPLMRPCDEIVFHIGDALGPPYQLPGQGILDLGTPTLNPTFEPAFGNGFMMATNLVTTPEPGSLLLLALGMAGLLCLLAVIRSKLLEGHAGQVKGQRAGHSAKLAAIPIFLRVRGRKVH